MGQLEPHQRVAGLQQRVVDGGVGLRAGVRLDVGVLGAEQRLGAVDRQLLGDVDVLAAAVVALAGIALGVLVGQHRALALEHRHRDEVLRGDHLQRALLALELERQHLGDLGIDLGEGAVEEVRRQLGAHGVANASGGVGSAQRNPVEVQCDQDPAQYEAPRPRPPPGRGAARPPRPRSPPRPATRAARRACSGGRSPASATSPRRRPTTGTTTSAEHEPPARGPARRATRRNRSRFSGPRRWCTHSALATRSNGPGGQLVLQPGRPRSSTRSEPADARAPRPASSALSSMPDQRRRRDGRRAAAAPSPPSRCPARAPAARPTRWPPPARPGSGRRRGCRRGSCPDRTPGRSGTATPARRAPSSAGTAPGRTISHARGSVLVARAGRRPSRPRPAARRRRSPGRRGAGSPPGTSASRRASGPPARLALDCSTGQLTPRSTGTTGTRSPSVRADRRRRPAESGAPGWAAAR